MEQIDKRKQLHDNDAVWAAFYRDGKTLAEIAQQFGCGIYDLSPWLTAPIYRAAMGCMNGAHDINDRVRKTWGSSWQGRIVGFYCTSLTPIGYAVESERERGSVQIYPESALERLPNETEKSR